MLLALALAAVQVAGTAAGPLYAPAEPPAAFGVNASFYRAAPGQADRMLASIEAGGIGTVREGRAGNWGEVEPSAPVDGVHHYEWATPDGVQASLAAHGLRWYAYIGLTPSWDAADASSPNGPPVASGIRDFAAYVRAFARRYGRDGTFWPAHPALPYLPVTDYELTNEPNDPALAGAWSPAELGRLTETAQAAIKSVDRRATVIPAAFSQLSDPASDKGDAGSFVAAMLKSRPGLDLDAIGLTLYRGARGSSGVPALETTLRGVRTELRAAGAGSVPIDVDEIGWIAGPNPYGVQPVTEDERAADLRAIASRWPQSNCAIRVILPFIWSDGIGNPGEVPSGFSLFTGDQGDDPTPSGSAYTWSVLRATGREWIPPGRERPEIC
jgi:hypothetical protein